MSRRKETSKAGCISAAIVTIIVIALVGGGTWFINSQYKQKQEAIASALAELPAFDEIEAGKEIANEAGVPYPVPSPTMTPMEISRKVLADAKELVKKEYPTSSFTKKQAEIFKKYRIADRGKKVSFVMKTTGKNINGAYQGTFSDHKGRYIKVDFTEYRIPDIMVDFHYLFIEEMAVKQAAEKQKELESQFKNDKKLFFLQQKDLLTEKLYNNSGYKWVDNKWVSNTETFNEKLEEAEKSFSKRYKREREKIYEANRLFGLFSVGIPEEETAPEENQD